MKSIIKSLILSSYSRVRPLLLQLETSYLSAVRKNWLQNNRYLTKDLSITEIRERTLSFVESMRTQTYPYGQYCYSNSTTKPVLYASCYAALIRHLYNDLDTLTESEKNTWCSYIQSFQCNDGLFRDPAIKNEIVETETWWGYHHLLPHVLMALTALGKKAEKRFLFLEKYKDKQFFKEYLANLNFGDRIAFTSNELHNLGTALQYARDFQNDKECQEPLDIMFGFLDKKAEQYDGLFGKHSDDDNSLSEAVQTGYHFLAALFL